MKKTISKIFLIAILAVASIYAIASVHALISKDYRYINFLIPALKESEQKLMEQDWQKEKESFPALNYGQWADEINKGLIKNFLLKEMSWKQGENVLKQEFHIFLTYQNGEVFLGEAPDGTARNEILDIYRFAQFKTPPIFWQETKQTIIVKEGIWKKLDLNDILTLVAIIMFPLIGGGLFWFMRWHATRGQVKLPPPYQTNISFDDVKAPPEVLEIADEIIGIAKYPHIFFIKGGKIPNGFLFSGQTGTGKTVVAAALAQKISREGILCYNISCKTLIQDTLGDAGAAASRIHHIFQQTKSKEQPCLLIFDEIHLFWEEKLWVVVSQLMDELSGLEKYDAAAFKEKNLTKTVVVLAITNRAEVIGGDKAFLRSGRFGRVIRFSLPNLPDRKAILEIHSRDKDFPPDKKEEWLNWLAEKTPDFNGADLQLVLEEAANRCVERINVKIRKGEILVPDQTYLQEPEKLKSLLAAEQITFSDLQLAYLEVKEQKEKAVS